MHAIGEKVALRLEAILGAKGLWEGETYGALDHLPSEILALTGVLWVEGIPDDSRYKLSICCRCGQRLEVVGTVNGLIDVAQVMKTLVKPGMNLKVVIELWEAHLAQQEG